MVPSSFSQHFLMLRSLSIAGKILIRRLRGFRLQFLASAGGEVIFVVRCAQEGDKVTIVSGRSRECVPTKLL